MRFEDVLPALREGKKVWRVAWKDRKPFGEAGTRLETYVVDDVLADDWEIIEQHKPCPFCGREPAAGGGISGIGVWCSGCGIGTGGYPELRSAWALWDRRA